MTRWRTLPLLAALLVWCGLADAGDYQIGAGDILVVSVFEHPDLNLKARVDPNGSINMPLGGTVTVSGLSERQAEAAIAKALRQGDFVSAPQVSVLVEQFQSRMVSVLGYVNRPGRYPMDRQLTVVEAIAMAGGVAVSGNEKVTLIGADNRRRQIDLRAALHEGSDPNPTLDGGEVIYVPKADVVYVFGEVQRPGAFPLEPHMTVQQGLAMAGSISPRGTDRGIVIRRQAADGKVSDVTAGFDDALQPGDVIVVRERLF
jgi:polysaccharide export outer membrane protein